jgi:hypothetical protein
MILLSAGFIPAATMMHKMPHLGNMLAARPEDRRPVENPLGGWRFRRGGA